MLGKSSKAPMPASRGSVRRGLHREELRLSRALQAERSRNRALGAKRSWNRGAGEPQTGPGTAALGLEVLWPTQELQGSVSRKSSRAPMPATRGNNLNLGAPGLRVRQELQGSDAGHARKQPKGGCAISCGFAFACCCASVFAPACAVPLSCRQ